MISVPAKNSVHAARLSASLGAYALVAAVLTLIGWAFEIRRLTAWDNTVSQMPNNAMAVMAAGAGLICLWRGHARTAAVFGAVASTIGAATLFEHLTSIDLGIDTLVLYRQWGQLGTTAPGRMGLPGSLSLVVVGLAIAARTTPRGERIATAGGLLTICIAILSLIGYIFGADRLYAIPRLTTIAVQTSSMMLALGAGVVAAVPHRQPMKLLLGDSAASLLVRRALPAIVLVPLLLGWLALYGQKRDLFDAAFGAAALVLMLIAVLAVLVWSSASAIAVHESAIRESRDRLAGLLGSITDAFISVNDQWRLVFVNEETETRLGKSRTQLLGTSIWEAFPEAESDESRRQLQRAMADRTTVEYEVYYPAWKRWFADRAYPTADGGLAIYSRDITASKEAEQAIRESERKFALLFEKAAFGAALAKFDGGRFVDVNDALLKTFGYSRDEVLGEPGVSAETIMGAGMLERVRDGGSLRDHETTLYTKSGEMRTIVNNITVIAIHGERHLLWTVQDITERKNVEEAMRRSAEALRRADRMKDEFLATLSHELRTPLTAIVGWSEILLHNELEPRERRVALEAIRNSAKVQAQLTEDILDVSRITTGKMRLARQHADLASIVEAAMTTVRPAAEARRVSLVLRNDETLPPQFVDRDRMQQVVWNLLSNAIKFSPAGSLVQVEIRQEDGTAVITVSDEGRGISRDFLPHIFERFRQADSSSTRTHGGLGIGLALAKDLVELHGGTISAESEEGSGSRFVIRLPLTTTQASMSVRGAAATTSRTSLRGVRVLYVDDREDARILISAMLHQHGAEVVQAESADDAIAALASHRPNVVVTDLAMPARDGYSLLEAIRSDERWSDLPVLALTAGGRAEDEKRAARAGFQQFLRKPIEAPALAAAIAEATTSRLS